MTDTHTCSTPASDLDEVEQDPAIAAAHRVLISELRAARETIAEVKRVAVRHKLEPHVAAARATEPMSDESWHSFEDDRGKEWRTSSERYYAWARLGRAYLLAIDEVAAANAENQEWDEETLAIVTWFKERSK